MRRRRWVLVGILVVVLSPLIAEGAVGAVHLSSGSGVCHTCHEMQPFYDSWSKSPHHSQECANCHIPKGPVGLIKAKVSALRQIYLHLTGGVKMPIEVVKTVPREACLTCHPQPRDRTYATSAFAHAKHETRDCADCHLRSIHLLEPAGPELGTMAACLTCHDGTTAPRECSTCHTPPHKGFGECSGCHRQDGWKQPVKLAAGVPRATCVSCHAQPGDATYATTRFAHAAHTSQECTACHAGIAHPSADPLPAPTMAACLACHDGKKAPQTCGTCHKPPHEPLGECTTCHKSTSWSAPVALSAKLSRTTCLVCHPKPGDAVMATSRFAHAAHDTTECTTCHAGITHPSTKGVTRPTMAACLACHDGTKAPKSCDTCHRPPHGEYGSCTMCHTTAAWLPTVTHPFALTGRHATLACGSCHKPADPSVRSALSVSDGTALPPCINCHGDHHGGLGDCARCHDPAAGWAPKSFKHPVVPGMALAGMECSVCHPKGYGTHTCMRCHGTVEGPGGGGAAPSGTGAQQGAGAPAVAP